MQTPAETFSPGGSDTGTVDPMDDETGDESSSGGALLDVGSAPEEPTAECASISQSTEIDERPSDIIVIADDDVDREFVKNNITNLLPGMETEGVVDAAVTLIVSGDAPEAVEGDEFSCGAWACRGASSFGAFTVLDRPVPAGAVLTELTTLRDDWSASLRETSWKHIWVMASTEADAQTTADAFLGTLDANFVVHAVVSVDGEGDATGFAGLAEATGGAYSQGDYNLSDFQDPMIERIQSTALACEYEIPMPPNGMVFARDKVNVLYDEGQGALPIGHVETAAACLAVGYGWHYDDATQPSRIIMCPESCERFEMLTNATIDIEFGCDTIPAG